MTGQQAREAVLKSLVSTKPGGALVPLKELAAGIGGVSPDGILEAVAGLVELGSVEVWDLGDDGGPLVILSGSEASTRGLKLHCPSNHNLTGYRWLRFEGQEANRKRGSAGKTMTLTDARASGELFDFDELPDPNGAYLHVHGDGLQWHGPEWVDRVASKGCVHGEFDDGDHYCLICEAGVVRGREFPPTKRNRARKRKRKTS